MNPNVLVKINALDNTKEAFRSLQQNMNTVQAETRTFSSTLESLQPTFQRMAIGGSAAFAAIGAGLGFSVREARNAEAAQFRLSQILRTATDASDAQIAALNAQAEALEQVGVISGESITQAQAQLATFDLQAETIGKLTPAILDYVVAEKGAAASTEDLKQLTNGLAQALNGNFGSLTRVGFVLDDVTKELISNGTEAERAAALVKVLNSTYEGMNVAARGTAEGGLVALSNEFGRLQETIGQQFLPVLDSVVAGIKPVLTSLINWIEANPTLARNIIVASTAIAGIVAAIGTIGLILPGIIVAFKAVAATVTVVSGALATLRIATLALLGPWGMLAAAATTIAAILGFKFAFGANTATAATESLQDVVNRFTGGLSGGQSKKVEDFSAAIGQVTSEAKQATDNIQKLKQEAQDIFQTAAEDEEEANRRMAEAIVEQEQSITDKKRELRKLERDDDTSSNEDRIDALRFTIGEEERSLRAFKGMREQLATEIEEAERRASLTAFERKMEDMLRERAARLEAQVARLLEIQAEVAAEKEKSNAIASAFEAGQGRMQEAIKVTGDIAVQEANRMSRAFSSVFNNMPSFGSTAIRNLTTPTVRRVNDAVISPSGSIVSTAPDDWLIATKRPGELAGAGGSNITININGTFMDDRTAAKRLSDEIMGTLRQQMRL